MTRARSDTQSAAHRLRVLFLSRKWRPAVGGMEQYSHELAASLESLCDLTVRALPGRANGMPPGILSQLVFFAKSLVFVAFSARRFDVIHAGDLALWPLALGSRIVSRRTQVVVSAHGTDIAYPVRPGLLPWIYGMYLRIGAVCGRHIRVIANSSATAALCRATGFFVARTIPLGVHAIAGPMPSVRRSGNYVLFVGRLARRKGCSWFIREVLTRLDQNIRLKIAGTVWDRRESAAVASDRVDYLGPVYGSELAALRREALAVVVPNISCEGRDFEGFGLTATEAAADGGVVLASRIDGLVDAVIDETSGFLLPPEDGHAWARKIEEIAQWSRRQRQDFVDRSRAAVAKRFNWQNVAAETLAVYQGKNVE